MSDFFVTAMLSANVCAVTSHQPVAQVGSHESDR